MTIHVSAYKTFPFIETRSKFERKLSNDASSVICIILFSSPGFLEECHLSVNSNDKRYAGKRDKKQVKIKSGSDVDTPEPLFVSCFDAQVTDLLKMTVTSIAPKIGVQTLVCS